MLFVSVGITVAAEDAATTEPLPKGEKMFVSVAITVAAEAAVHFLMAPRRCFD